MYKGKLNFITNKPSYANSSSPTTAIYYNRVCNMGHAVMEQEKVH